MVSITKIFEFSAGHRLPFHEGLCKNNHGHNYKLEVEVKGTLKRSGPNTGMVMDFGELKAIVQKHIIDIFDHVNLNSVYENPTAEVMVKSIASMLETPLKYKAKIIRVRLWETSNSYTEWREE